MPSAVIAARILSARSESSDIVTISRNIGPNESWGSLGRWTAACGLELIRGSDDLPDSDVVLVAIDPRLQNVSGNLAALGRPVIIARQEVGLVVAMAARVHIRQQILH